MKTSGASVMVALAIMGQGCTTYLYKGPTRPSAQVAVVTSRDTIVESVDGVRIRDYASGSHAQLELLPGPHRLTITLNRVTPGFFVTSVERSNEVEICVQLYPGHSYQTSPTSEGNIFLPVVFDVSVGNQARRCGAPQLEVSTINRPQAREAVKVPLEATGEQERKGTEPLAPGGASADTLAAPPAPPRPSAAMDTEEPTTTGPLWRTARARPHLPSDAQLANRRPGNGLSLMFGGAFGGEDFVKATSANGEDGGSLSAGSGVILGIGAMLTPLWAGDTVGFGLGANAAIKYDHLGAMNGSASITRYPIAFTAHALLNVSGGMHYIIVKGGVNRDFGVNYSSSGFLDVNANVPATWGPTGTVGYYKKSNDSLAWDILAFFALTKHLVGPERIDANSFGMTFGMHWLL